MKASRFHKIAATLFITAFFTLSAAAQEGVTDTSADTNTNKTEDMRTSGQKNIFDFGGYIWIDNGYMSSTNAKPSEGDSTKSYQGGRLVLDIKYRRQLGDFYAEAKGELLAHVDDTTEYKIDTLDSYIKFGTVLWDLQFGRFLAWEVYHKGQGLELYTDEDLGAIDGPNLYEVDFTRGHAKESGQAAFHLFPFKGLNIEIASNFGKDNTDNFYGVRPVIDFSIWKFQVVAGYEYLTINPVNSNPLSHASKWGYGGRFQYNSDIITAGVNYAHAKTESYDITGVREEASSGDIDSLGAFLDIDFWKNSIGFGCHYTWQETLRGDKYDHLQPFVSYLYRLPVKGLSVKLVLATARANIEDKSSGGEWGNDMYSARIRIRYDFE